MDNCLEFAPDWSFLVEFYAYQVLSGLPVPDLLLSLLIFLLLTLLISYLPIFELSTYFVLRLDLLILKLGKIFPEFPF